MLTTITQCFSVIPLQLFLASILSLSSSPCLLLFSHHNLFPIHELYLFYFQHLCIHLLDIHTNLTLIFSLCHSLPVVPSKVEPNSFFLPIPNHYPTIPPILCLQPLHALWNSCSVSNKLTACHDKYISSPILFTLTEFSKRSQTLICPRYHPIKISYFKYSQIP